MGRVLLAFLFLWGLSLVAAQNCLVCPEDVLVNAKLRDRKFIDSIIRCMLDQGPCESPLSRELKRTAPDVFKGHCPSPCNCCTKKQVSKIFKFMQTHYPAEFNDMLFKYASGSRGA